MVARKIAIAAIVKQWTRRATSSSHIAEIGSLRCGKSVGRRSCLPCFLVPAWEIVVI
jgi:hypothetical protein